MTACLIAAGANLGDRDATLDQAFAHLAGIDGLTIEAVSSYHRTAPVGGPAGQGEFLNAAARATTTLSPQAVLAALLSAEQASGRVRRERWAARTVDLDLLLYGDKILAVSELTVPHPRMAVRRFVLAPAAEVAASMVHPVLGRTIGSLLTQLNDADNVLALRLADDPTQQPGDQADAVAWLEAVADRLADDGHPARVAWPIGGVWTAQSWAELTVPDGGTLLVAGVLPPMPAPNESTPPELTSAASRPTGPNVKVHVELRIGPSRAPMTPSPASSTPRATSPHVPSSGEPIPLVIGPASRETVVSEIAAAALAMR